MPLNLYYSNGKLWHKSALNREYDIKFKFPPMHCFVIITAIALCTCTD